MRAGGFARLEVLEEFSNTFDCNVNIVNDRVVIVMLLFVVEHALLFCVQEMAVLSLNAMLHLWNIETFQQVGIYLYIVSFLEFGMVRERTETMQPLVQGRESLSPLSLFYLDLQKKKKKRNKAKKKTTITIMEILNLQLEWYWVLLRNRMQTCNI
jgi:hypothetical protein